MDTLTDAQKAAWWHYILGPRFTPTDPGSAYRVALGSTIGTMIAFLYEAQAWHKNEAILDTIFYDQGKVQLGWWDARDEVELCDALFAAVKDVLARAVE